jgi:WD40 repeat protein
MLKHQVVRECLDLAQPLQAICVSPTQGFAALACHSHVQIISLNPTGIKKYFEIEIAKQSGDIFTMTDVDWNSYDNDRIAASATNGSIFVLNMNAKGSKIEWNSETTSSRAVNRVCWHRTERNTLGSVHQDGTIRIWDSRVVGTTCSTVIDTKADASRDIHFNPNNPNYVAAVFENGNLTVWDRRKTDSPWINISAHSSTVMTVAWHPTKEWLLASGSRDKSVKIWDVSNVVDESKVSSLRPECVLHTSSAVSRICWRPSSSNNPNSIDQIASIPSSERGDISVWRLDMNNIPACILRGHVDGCMGLQWLDTPISSATSPSVNHSGVSERI